MSFKDSVQKANDKLNSILGKGGKSWRDELKEASYNSKKFDLVNRSDLAFGNNNQVDEYLKADPEVKPLGKKAKQLNITGLVAGENYLNKRDELITVLNKAEPGVFEDPTKGSMNVLVDDVGIAETHEEGGMAVFDITFTLTTDPQEMGRKESVTGESLLEKANELLNKGIKVAVDNINVVSQPARILNAATKKIKSEVLLAKDRVRSATTSAINEYVELLETHINDGKFLFSFDNLLELQLAITGFDNTDDLTMIAKEYDDKPLEKSSASSSKTRQAELDNEAVINRFFLTSSLGAIAKLIPDTEFETVDEVEELRNELCKRLVEVNGGALAAKAYSYLSTEALGLPSLTEYTPERVMSCLEVSQFLYGTGERADEIATRNAIPHMGFIPPGRKLKVLDV